jgi:hypothetical protein
MGFVRAGGLRYDIRMSSLVISPPDKTLEPTRVGAFSSAVAGDASLSRVAQLGRSAWINFWKDLTKGYDQHRLSI